jgi:glycosyltransferase involved in cell wall biosynthesis
MRIAFVCPWYGADIPGGAEAEARRTVENLHQRRIPVEVWTTCVKDFEGDWGRNYYPAGDSEVNGVLVRRFPVGPRNGELFSSLNRRILSGEKLSGPEEDLFFQHMINSPLLYQYIRLHGPETLLFFIPYLFSTTYYGARILPDRSFIIPCLHDEGYAHLEILGELFHRVRGMIFHTRFEMNLGQRLYGLTENQTHLFGEGIDTEICSDPERFRQKFRIKEPYLLYAGRRDAGKNTPLLMNYFALFKERCPSNLRLLLIGNLPVQIPLDWQEDILDLGFVSRQDKYDAYGGAELFCQPSVMESFSIVIMESWLCGTPVLVNAHCPVTVEHCQNSQGGLFFKDYLEFEGCLLEMEDHSETFRAMAGNGRDYVLSHFHWDLISERYIQLIHQSWQDLEEVPRDSGQKEKSMKNWRRKPDLSIHQMLPDFSYGDAIGNDVLGIQKVLRDWGYDSEIYAQHVHSKLTGAARPFQEYKDVSHRDKILIFHFSIGSELSEFVKRLPDRKILIYHNITPSHFFKGINAEVERRCDWGYEELKKLAPYFDLALGVSDFNRQDLERAGFRKTGVLPIFIDFKNYYIVQDENLKKSLQDGKINILHVGRLVPQKKIEDLIRVFYLFQKRLFPESRLILVGTDSGVSNYSRAIKKMVEELALTEKVLFAGFASFRELITYYKTSQLYLCLSEHEGFCVPLVESMFFSLPVIAYLTGGIPETLGGAGIGLARKNLEQISEMMALVLEDDELRENIISGQKERLEDLSLEKNKRRLQAHLAPFLEGR